jgi:4-carboxymuconolactone decarboxylase
MMRLVAAGLLGAMLSVPLAAQDKPASIAPADMHWVAPALADYTDDVLYGDVWKRPELNLRDRSLVTISALIAEGNTAQLKGHFNRALDNGVEPSEIGGVVTHLAFYSGWPKAVSSLAIAREVLESRGVKAEAMQASGQMPVDNNRAQVVRKNTGPVTRGSAINFTGKVTVSGRVSGFGVSRIGGATVRFEAGARSAWHRHALGQTLIVTEGCGWTQSEGGPVGKMCAGDVVTVAPQVAHWHGAMSTSAMAHVALSESREVEWLAKVTDVEYALGNK